MRLQIGCASGKTTVPRVRRGFRITCVEIGLKLATKALGVALVLAIAVLGTRASPAMIGLVRREVRYLSRPGRRSST